MAFHTQTECKKADILKVFTLCGVNPGAGEWGEMSGVLDYQVPFGVSEEYSESRETVLLRRLLRGCEWEKRLSVLQEFGHDETAENEETK